MGAFRSSPTSQGQILSILFPCPIAGSLFPSTRGLPHLEIACSLCFTLKT